MIKIKNLWKKYNGRDVLQGLDLEILEGETLVILGRSGVGKSVLLRLVMGIEKPDRGSIEINGVDITKLSDREITLHLKEMGMLFQASALFDSLNVKENSAFYLRENEDPREKRFLTDEEIDERVTYALSMVGLVGKEEVMPADLSGGMKKRAALARLIVYRPKILLYDEPTTGLDPITARQINDLIVKTQKDLNVTSIVVTHDFNSAWQVADRIALSHEGKIAYSATKEAFIKIKDPMIQAFLQNSLLDGLRHL